MPTERTSTDALPGGSGALPGGLGGPDVAGGAWPGDWLRGALGLCVLRALDDGPTYGYALVVRLAEGGLGTIKGGTLYPLLSRLEQARLVDVEWRAGEGGPGRKYYRLTDDGRAELSSGVEHWRRFAGVTTDFMAAGPVAPAAMVALTTPSATPTNQAARPPAGKDTTP